MFLLGECPSVTSVSFIHQFCNASARSSSTEAFFFWKIIHIIFSTPAPRSQHGPAAAGYFSQGVDQTTGSPRSNSSGGGSLCCPPPLYCHGFLHDITLVHPLLLFYEAKAPALKSSTLARHLRKRQDRTHQETSFPSFFGLLWKN